MSLAVAITPTQVVLVGLSSLTLVATVSGGSGSIVWSVDGIVGGNSDVGTIVAGVYTAPALTGFHNITATVTSGSETAFASASVNVQAYSPAVGGEALSFGTHLTGGPYDGTAPETIATDATSADTPSTIVARDASGNFSAGQITAAILASLLKLSVLPPIYANNAAAIAGGLTAGAVYRLGGDPDSLAIVH